MFADRKHSSTHLPVAFRSLGLNRHSPTIFIKIHYAITAFYIQKILTNREMVNFQKLDFFRFLTINSVTIGVRELNGTIQISLSTHNSKREMRVSSGLAIMLYVRCTFSKYQRQDIEIRYDKVLFETI